MPGDFYSVDSREVLPYFDSLVKFNFLFLGSDSFSPIRDGPDVRFPEEELDNQIISMINATISAPSGMTICFVIINTLGSDLFKPAIPIYVFFYCVRELVIYSFFFILQGYLFSFVVQNNLKFSTC